MKVAGSVDDRLEIDYSSSEKSGSPNKCPRFMSIGIAGNNTEMNVDE